MSGDSRVTTLSIFVGNILLNGNRVVKQHVLQELSKKHHN